MVDGHDQLFLIGYVQNRCGMSSQTDEDLARRDVQLEILSRFGLSEMSDVDGQASIPRREDGHGARVPATRLH